ncbi:MAG: hypothetical protein R3266_12940, partial [Gemmatimonadota bacterium]|nr:hypothetical protein [Gemmatimonadota bacterium]
MSGFLWRVMALGFLGAGLVMLARGAGSVSLAILLLIAGLAAAGVLLGGGRHGHETEGRLDLSARLGLGLLGGVLGALVSGLLRVPLVELGIGEALGVTLPSLWIGRDLLLQLGSGAIWGMVVGILYPQIPGHGAAARGAWVSLIPSLSVLL